MTLQEAIKSGKPFKRKHWVAWITPDEDWQTVTIHETQQDDWIVKQEPIVIEGVRWIHGYIGGEEFVGPCHRDARKFPLSLEGKLTKVTIEVVE